MKLEFRIFMPKIMIKLSRQRDAGYMSSIEKEVVCTNLAGIPNEGKCQKLSRIGYY